ncbi:MAG: hypothetical protein ABSB35_03945 [Bryobacteraceae bacterium]|jgi:hypothetical protein
MSAPIPLGGAISEIESAAPGIGNGVKMAFGLLSAVGSALNFRGYSTSKIKRGRSGSARLQCAFDKEHGVELSIAVDGEAGSSTFLLIVFGYTKHHTIAGHEELRSDWVRLFSAIEEIARGALRATAVTALSVKQVDDRIADLSPIPLRASASECVIFWRESNPKESICMQ